MADGNFTSSHNVSYSAKCASAPVYDLTTWDALTKFYHPFANCTWLPINHIFFQIANLFLLLSYVAPNNKYAILYLRTTLMVGSAFFSLWGWLVLCAMDTMIWNIVFTIINFIQVICLLYTLRPIKFSWPIEHVYRRVFRPLKVSRYKFTKVLRCMKEVKNIPSGQSYASEKLTKVETIALVLCGRFNVVQQGKLLSFVEIHQFLDSPEWFTVTSDEYYKVTVTAVEDSMILVWNRDKLKLSILNDQFLQAIFDHILGKDVVNKLLQLNDCYISTTVSNEDDVCDKVANISETNDSSKLLLKERKSDPKVVINPIVEDKRYDQIHVGGELETKI